MTPQITLYGYGTTRSARCWWALLESGLEFEYVDDGGLIRSDDLKALHPLAKLPALLVDGQPLFESAAICSYVCDLAPESGLIASSGTWQRALHEQWTSFVLTELEAYLWSNAKHTAMYPEARRVPAVVAPNQDEARAALGVLEAVLAQRPYLTGEQFQVTDIIAGWTINWARRSALLDAHPNLEAYLARLMSREHCKLNPD